MAQSDAIHRQGGDIILTAQAATPRLTAWLQQESF
ncbi:hypothetical protein G9274_002448 [Stenotrophomonas rhizophila]|nr:hypothetical protein G9274_002448 [Stenotrophomonas rhizophila]